MDRWLHQEFRDFVAETFGDLLRALARALDGRLCVLDPEGRVIAPQPEAAADHPPDGHAAEGPAAGCSLRVPITLPAPEPSRLDPDASADPTPWCLGHLSTPLAGPEIEALLANLAAEIARQFEVERECDREIEAIGALRHEIDLLDHVARARRSELNLAAAARDLLAECADLLDDASPIVCLAVGGRIEWIAPHAADPSRRPELWADVAGGGVGGDAEDVARAILVDLARPAGANRDHVVLHRKVAAPWGAVDGAFTSWVSGDAIIGFVGILHTGPAGTLAAEDIAVLRCLAGELAHAAERHARHRELRDMLFNTIKSLVAAVDAKDEYTRGHSERVHRLALRLGRALGLADADRQRLSWAALLHDVGKIATPEKLLAWRNDLAADEEQLVRAHVVQGCDLLAPIPQLHAILPAIRHHHERFDGRGYPDGLAGERIPLHARIIAVAETFDALTHAPTPEVAVTESAALRLIAHDAKTRFDPDVVQALATVLAKGSQETGAGSEDEDLMLPDFGAETDEDCGTRNDEDRAAA